VPFKDVREFIDKLVKEGEAIKVEEEFDWNLEVGAVIRKAVEADLPATLFQNIKGYPKGYRIFGGGTANFRRMAIAMDMPSDTHPRELVEEFGRRRHKIIKPVLVSDGPCKENIITGDDVDLLKFPVPYIHGGDGGRMVGTWHLTISKDEDTGWVNWGMYRHMLQTKNAVGILTAAHAKHLAAMYLHGSYAAENKPMEVAIAIGPEPISAFTSTMYIPYGISEVDVAGGIRGEPIEIIKCETIDLVVPAAVEIVIEGEYRMDDLMDEGPYGEYSGFRAGVRTPRPVIRVKAITHRNDPIFTMDNTGVPPGDGACMCLTKASEMLELLKARGLPVTGVCVFPEAGLDLAAVAIKVTYAHIAEDVAHVIWGAHIGHSVPYIAVVEDDVDPFNLSEVVHAIATKCNPYKGIVRLDRSPVLRITPFLNREEQMHGSGAKAYFDCTWPTDWPPEDIPERITFKNSYPLEAQEKALAMWRKYGY